MTSFLGFSERRLCIPIASPPVEEFCRLTVRVGNLFSSPRLQPFPRRLVSRRGTASESGPTGRRAAPMVTNYPPFRQLSHHGRCPQSFGIDFQLDSTTVGSSSTKVAPYHRLIVFACASVLLSHCFHPIQAGAFSKSLFRHKATRLGEALDEYR